MLIPKCRSENRHRGPRGLARTGCRRATTTWPLLACPKHGAESTTVGTRPSRFHCHCHSRVVPPQIRSRRQRIRAPNFDLNVAASEPSQSILALRCPNKEPSLSCGATAEPPLAVGRHQRTESSRPLNCPPWIRTPPTGNDPRVTAASQSSTKTHKNGQYGER